MGAGATRPDDGNGSGRSKSLSPLSRRPKDDQANPQWEYANNEHRVLICRFCGGKKCKREDYTRQKEAAAIHGLHSSWVGEDIIAMQRPSSRLIGEYDILAQFKAAGVGAVVNLQAHGEHPLCGDGINKEGFSYHPEEFMNAGVYFYNFGFTDMGVPSLDLMMTILHSIAFHIEINQHKVAIHCHAGYGRTGIVIACWLIYGCGMQPEPAMNYVREQRPGCIETGTQKDFVLKFSTDLTNLRRVFILPPFLYESFTIHDALARQNNYLHGPERESLSRVPKIVHVLCAELRSRGGISAHELADAFVLRKGWLEQDEKELVAAKERVNVDKWDTLKESSTVVLAQLLLDWLDTLMEPLFPFEATEKVLKGLTPDSAMDGVVSEYSIQMLNTIVELMQALYGVEKDLSEKLYRRFAFALMHPQLDSPPFRTLRSNGDWAVILGRGKTGPKIDEEDLTDLAGHLRRFVHEWDDWFTTSRTARPHVETLPVLASPKKSTWSSLDGRESNGIGLEGGVHGRAPEALGIVPAEEAEETDPLEDDIGERVAALFAMLGPRKQGYVINELLSVYGRTRLLSGAPAPLPSDAGLSPMRTRSEDEELPRSEKEKQRKRDRDRGRNGMKVNKLEALPNINQKSVSSASEPVLGDVRMRPPPSAGRRAQT